MRLGIKAKLPAKRQSWLLKCVIDCCWLAAIAVLLTAAPASAMQEKPSDQAGQEQDVISPPKPNPFEAEMAKYPGLLPELGQTLTRIMKAVELPTARTQSRLLPMLPENTVIFAASPNYGNTVHQALQAFQQELKESEVLRNWWQHTELNSGKPTLEEALEKFYEFSQYLGDEIAVSADVGEKKESILVVAGVRKPGLQLFLQQLGQQFGGKTGPPWRLLDAQQLALAKGSGTSSQPLVLIRSNLLVIASDLATLRSFNATLPGGGKLDAGPFGQRLIQSYQGGAGILAGIDFRKLMARIPKGGAKEQEELQHSGFGDVKYLIWEHKNVPGEPASKMELSFNGKRHGVASWLGSPTKLGGLDFVAPDATIALSLVLKNPALIYDDLAVLAGPGGLDAVTQPAEAFKINLRDDVLAQLTGEITMEVDGSFLPVSGEAAPEPLWKVIVGVHDAEGLQKTFDRLAEALSAMSPDGQGPSLKRHEAGQLSYYTLQIPSPQKATEINWAFSDGYMLVASTRARITEAIRFHRDGQSLVRSGGFHTAFPVGQPADASALFYQNVGPLLAPFMQQLSPDLAKLATESGAIAPVAISTVYADDTTIRQASSSGSLDVGVMAAVAAIAIPNLLRARTSANEAAAASTVRTLVTSEVTYSASYPLKGYATDLSSLGGSSAECSGSSASEKHACLIDDVLGSPSCTAGKWCPRDSYRYHLAARCPRTKCVDFVVVASPKDANQGQRNFCATADGVVRYQKGGPLTTPITFAACMKWEPL